LSRNKRAVASGAVPWGEIGQRRDHAANFMLKVFGLTPDQYMITDGSSLRDFLGFEGLDDTPAIQRKIADVFGVDIRLLGSERIVDVVKVIANLH